MTYQEFRKSEEDRFDKRFPANEILEAVDIGEGQGDVIPVGIEFQTKPDPNDVKSFLADHDERLLAWVREVIECNKIAGSELSMTEYEIARNHALSDLISKLKK